MRLSQTRQADLFTNTQGATPLRFTPVIHLLSGDMMGQLCEPAKLVQDSVRFGPVTGNLGAASPSSWLSSQLRAVASATHGQPDSLRPILMPVPSATLNCAQTRQVCCDAVKETCLSNQEICLELSDSAFTGDIAALTSKVQAFRKDGFRVAINMMDSWQAVLDDTLRLLIDTIRVDVEELYASPTLAYVAEAAANAGIFVIAENAKWRDGEYLADLGVGGAIRPRTDA